MFKFYRSVLAAGVVALGLAACGDNVTVQPPPPPSGGGVTSVTVTPANITIGVGQTEQLALNVVADSGVAKTVNWTTGNAAVATVSATGVVTGVGLGSTSIIATSTANSSISGAVQVTVSNAATFSITPNTLSLAPGQSSNVVATAVLQAGQTASPIVWSSLTPSVATVANGCTTTAGSSTCAITGVSQGSAVITAATTVGGQNLTATLAVTIGAGASISIASVTEGATAGVVPGCSGVVGAPVILTNTNCEIEVNLNFSAGVQRIDSVTVWFQQGSTIKKLARQAFGGTVPAAGPLSLQVNTANFTKNVATGVARVDLWNGPTTLIAQVWPTVGTGGSAINCAIGGGNADPTCSNLSMILNNTDGWAADMTKCDSVIANGVVCAAAVPAVGPGGTNASTGGFAVSTAANAGASYWGGPGPSGQITAELYAVVYNDNPAFPAGSQLNRCANVLGDGSACINSVSWTIGSVFANCGPVTQSEIATPATPFFRQVFGTGSNSTNSCSSYENIGIRRDNVIVAGGAQDAQNNVFPTGPLIPNTVVFGATPDSNRFDYKAPSNVQRPTGEGWEEQHWVNATWQFNSDGTLIIDNGVGPALTSWRAFASAQGGPFTVFPTAITSGADLPETNTNTTDGFAARAWATDLLGNINKSAVTTTFGVDKTAPLLRYSTIAAPSLYASIYTGGGSAAVLDSTTYNAFQGLYGANVVTAGAQDLFVGAAAGTNDSVRVEAIDGRSGLFRGIETVNKFAQGGATGATSSVVAVNFTIFDANNASIGFLPATIDGWLPLHAQGVTGGSVAPGYYTTTMYTVDKAGNASGCPDTRATDGANGGACTAAAPAAGNLFARRTLALDPGQPQVTGVSPNNSYVGNAPAVFTLGSQNDLEVIDAKLRLLYPNLTIGDGAGTIPAAGSGGLVWTYALSGTFMSGSGGGSSISSGPAAGSATAFGFFDPIAKRFDNSIINPSVSPLTLDMFTTNVQETCTGTTGTATGPTTAADCGVETSPVYALFVGDPIPTDAGGFALAIPTNVGVQVRDVFGSWIFNTTASAVTGVSNEFVSPILSATVTPPVTTYSVQYFDPGLGQSCPAGGAVQPAGSPTCVTGNSSINFRADNFLTSGSTKVFRATEALSRSLPIFTRVDLFGLNAQQQWVFIARIVVPNPVSVGAACPAAAPGSTGVVGCDNGLERYWLYTFTGVPATFTEYRAIGVDANGSGLASTIHS